MILVWTMTVVIAVAASVIYWVKIRPKEVTAEPKPEPDKGDKFGHQFYPIDEVRKGVHKPPVGHFWELGVTHDESGGRWLVLRAVHYETSKAVDEKRVSLDVVGESGVPWSEKYEKELEYYHRHSYIYEQKRPTQVQGDARTQIVRPLTEWSRATFLKHSTDPGVLVDTVVIA
ncbi:hypothetical protein [Rhodococcus erythropolis]|uniref:hypothetical protein n=1 Tax=Rhodococcus erythropolis TaxID=1833 RepID=UPI001BE77F97|nr:hypothetical protein [Rhodococcus erythropolis]MBT2266425.1 hypothetical protein [Rhodococcus erythropolis]